MKTIKLDLQRDNFTTLVYKENFLGKSKTYDILLQNIVSAFSTIEYLSVAEGVRDAHLTFIHPKNLEKKLSEFKKFGLDIVLLNREGDSTSKGYGNHSLPYDGGDSFVWRSIITKPEFVDSWKEIWDIREHDVLSGEYLIGRGLGYPDCCCKFFTEVWMRQGYIDTTWQQALNTKYPVTQGNVRWWKLPEINGTEIELPNHTEIWASNLLRWVGLKLVSQLPCSFDCKESKKIAIDNITLAKENGFEEEYSKLCQMLDWEIKWTAEHGVATIETPAFIVSTVTDITTEKYTVIKHGHNNCVL